MDLALIVGIGALIVALAGFVYKILSDARARRRDDRQRVRSVLAANGPRFEALRIVLESKPEPCLKKVLEQSRLYLEVRDTYRSHRHGFSKADQAELDTILDLAEQRLNRSDPEGSFRAAQEVMPEFMRVLQAKLNR